MAGKKPGKVYLAPQLEELDSMYDGEYLNLEVPKIEGHQMIVLEF